MPMMMMIMMHSPEDSLEFSLLQSRTLCWTNLVRSARSYFRRQPPQVRKSPPVLLFLVSSETEEKITNVKIDLQLWIVKIFSGDCEVIRQVCKCNENIICYFFALVKVLVLSLFSAMNI